jgi:hypothetical protein
MKKSPKGPISTPNGQSSSGALNRSRLDSADLRASIAAADIVRAYDPGLGGGTVFFGREMMEEAIRTGVALSATVVRVALDFTSDEPERLDALIRELKGNSCFRAADIFPEIDIGEASFSAAPELLEPVRLAVCEVRAQHRTLLPLMQRRFYYDVRARGFMAAHDALKEGTRLARQAGATDAHQGYWVCLLTLGSLLYQHLPRDLIQPSRCLDLLHRFGPHDRKLTVVCRSLQVEQTPTGPAYFSRRMPRMRFRGEPGDWVVAFSKHALEQICERTVYDWRSYGGHGDAFAFFEQCVYFEDCTAERGEPSFVVYNSCVPHFTTWNYVAQVLENPVPGRRYYYRVGYCPVALQGNVAKAITLLVPGMKKNKGTPEGKLIEQSGLPTPEVVRLQAQVERQKSMRELEDSGDYSLIKWFHENGVPQVVEFEHDVFKYDCETPQGWREIGDGGRTIDLGF